jgi:2,3-dimethylmalate lyase
MNHGAALRRLFSEKRILPRLGVYDALSARIAAHLVEGGKTPYKTVPELEKMGYAVAQCPMSTLLASTLAVRKSVEALLRDGGTQALSGELMSFRHFNELIGLEEYS